MQLIRVLIVEDDRSQRALLVRLLTRAMAPREVAIDEADSIASAISRCRVGGECYDVVLLDLQLPDSEGARTFRTLRNLGLGAAFLVVTASSDEDLERELIREGVQEYLVKGSFDEPLLRRAVDHAMDRETLRRDLERSREEVKAGELAFEAQYRGAPIPIYTFAHEQGQFTLVDCNDEALAATGGGALNLLRQNLDELHPPDSLMARSIRQAFSSKEVVHAEIDYQFLAIEKRTILDATFAFVPPQFVMVYAKDIGVERGAIEKLKTSEARFRSQFEQSLIPMFVWCAIDDDFEFVDYNAAAIPLTGKDPRSLLGVRASVALRESPELLEAMAKCYRVGRPISLSVEAVIGSRGRRIVDISVGAFDVDGLILHVQDITEVVEAQQKIATSERDYRVFFEESPAGKLIVSSGGLIVEANAQITRILGYAAAELKAMPFADLMARGRATEMGEDALARHDGELLRKNGTFASVELSSSRLDDGRRLIDVRDLSDIRAAKARETFQANLLANVINSIVATDTHGIITYWNRSAERLFGWTANEAIGRQITELLVPDDAQEMTRELFARLPQLRRFDGEMHALRRDGTDVPVYVTISTVADAEGNPSGYVAVYFDLSDLRAEQEARRKNETLLSAVLDALPVGVFIFDPDGAIVRSNPAARAIWGIEEAAWQGSYGEFRAWWPLTGRELGADEWPMVHTRRDGIPILDVELEIERFDHHRRAILSSTFPILGDEGRVVAGVAVNQDITDQRLTEESLRRSEELFRSLVENLSEVITILDAEGTILYESSSVTTALGYDSSELVGINVTELLHPGDVERMHGHLREQMNFRSEVHSLTMDLRHKDGSWRTFDINTRGVRGDQWNIIATSRDVTERNALEERLQQMDRVSSLGRVAANVAHEINNVLMGIQPFAQLIQRRAAGDADLERASIQIGRALQRGKRVTQEILRFTQPAEPELATIDVPSLVESFRAEAQHLLGTAIDFVVIVEGGPLTVEADADQLTQVLTNLLLNARDAIDGAGHVTVLCRRDREVIDPRSPDGSRDMVHIEVRDSGRGIPQEVTDKIFEPLFTTKPRGTGLGLSVVHQIIKTHGGEIHLESREKVGTSFHIMLPSAADGIVEEAPTPRAAEPESEVRRVLLVEDDPVVTLGLSMLLESEGFSVQTVLTGGEAAPEIERFRPDIVLLDYGLPDMTGVDVFKIIRARWPDLPVIFSTGQGDRNALRESIESGGVGYLLKPYELNQLLDEMRRITE